MPVGRVYWIECAKSYEVPIDVKRKLMEELSRYSMLVWVFGERTILKILEH